jgi:inositol-phosphate phosphatase/L-galactose 1-phosphate phosphatase/histidinol-phosphatase
MTDDIDQYTALAIELADAARPIALGWFRRDFETVTKDDASPVTIADRECEALMRERIRAAFPDHGIIGEEHGSENPGASHVWVLDPIDGTKSFVTGRPLFGALIALCRDGRPIVGVIDCAAVGDRWVGASGRGTTHNGAPCRARSCASLADAYLYSTTPFMFEGRDRDGFERLCRRVKYPLFGSDCHGYGLVASGWADIVVEAQLKVHDYAALVPVAEGAGALLTDWEGSPLDLASDGRVLMAGDADRHREALAVLRGG